MVGNQKPGNDPCLTIPFGAVKITLRCRITLDVKAEIAQLVEHATENRGVASSNLALGTNTLVGHRAEVAQLVEHHLAKVRVAGSSPVFRSIHPRPEAASRHPCPFV